MWVWTTNFGYRLPRLGLDEDGLLLLAVGPLFERPLRPADFFVPFLGLDLKPFRPVL